MLCPNDMNQTLLFNPIPLKRDTFYPHEILIVYHMTKPGGKRVNYHWYQEHFLVNNSVMAEDVYSKTSSRISVRNSDWRNHMTEISSEFRYRLLLCKINFLRRNFVTKVDNNNSNFKFRPEFYSNSSRL